MTFRVGILVFPGFQQLGLTGAYEVFAEATGAAVALIWKDREPVSGSGGLVVHPTATLGSCGALDALCILGGPTVSGLLDDPDIVDFVRSRAQTVRFIGAVSCGGLLLGAAGILQGRRATTHWLSYDSLERFGATPVDARIVQDGSLITTNNQPSAIDLALRIVAGLAGEEEAETIQLMLEHSPSVALCSAVIVAPPALLLDAESRLSPVRQQRETALRRLMAPEPAATGPDVASTRRRPGGGPAARRQSYARSSAAR